MDPKNKSKTFFYQTSIPSSLAVFSLSSIVHLAFHVPYELSTQCQKKLIFNFNLNFQKFWSL